MKQMMDYKKYLDILRDPEYIELYNYYSKETMMGILGVDRQENPHSGFLRWLLDIHGAHGYGDMAMRKFLETVCLFHDKVYEDTPRHKAESERTFWRQNDTLLNEKNKDILDEIRYGRYEVVHQSIANETVLDGQRRADIFAVLELKMQRMPETRYLILLIENKVRSLEHDSQTENYVKTVGNSQELQKALLNQNKGLKIDWTNKEGIENIAKKGLRLYVFLNAYTTGEIKAALGKDQPQFAKSKEFITVNYQYLLDGMFEPLSNLTNNVEIKQRMKDYIRCLGQAKITSIDETGANWQNDKEYLIMAVSGHEKELAVSLWKKYNHIIYSILKSHFHEGEFLLNESDRDFWISYSNLLLLIDQKELIGEEVQSLIRNANRAPGKRKFCFRGETYESYQPGKKNIGALCRDIIGDLIKNEDDVEQWIEKLREKCKNRLSWLGKSIFSEADVQDKKKEDSDGLYYLSVKCHIDEKEYRREDYFYALTAKGGRNVYVDKYWSVDYMFKMIKFIDKEYNREYEREVEKID